MKITAGILFYLLDRYNNMQHICHGADRMPLKRSEHFRNQKQTESGVLYIYPDKKGVLLFCSEKRQKPASILIKAFKESEEGFSSLWIPYDNLDEETENHAHLADEVSEYVSQIWNSFGQVQNEILEAVIEQENIDEMMARVQTFFRELFTVVDRDMQLLYRHPEIPERLTRKLGEDFSDEIQEELLMAKEFHEVAKLDQPFYYYMKNLDERQYCVNIVVDGYYYARLVTFVEEGKETIPSGAEQITEYLAGVLVQMIRSGSLKVSKQQNDQLHILCQRLIGGHLPETSEIREAVETYQWKSDHTYQVVCLEPYHASGWETQVENTMPIMTRKLEQNWRHSCAVFSGDKILWVINRTLSANAESAYEQDQKLMVLLRENVLRAGASSEFQDATLLSSALKEAKAALEIGTKKDASHWYFRFDDYRLLYMLEAIKEKGIEERLLIHPAIPKLMEYDKTHESQLAETLKVFLENQQNVTQTADALFIHRTTLFRRLNQLKKIVPVNLEDPDEVLSLLLSFRLL